jgi:hypothetical protein
MSRQIPLNARKLLHLLCREVQIESVLQGNTEADRVQADAQLLLAERPDVVRKMREELTALWTQHQHVPSITVALDDLLRKHTNRRSDEKGPGPCLH